jgi:UDP-N-acetylmuramate--alanine ligase
MWRLNVDSKRHQYLRPELPCHATSGKNTLLSTLSNPNNLMRWRDFDSLPPFPDDFFEPGPRRVHFIGVGGIGMSGLAQVLAARGHHVSGSDPAAPEVLAALQEQNIRCFSSHEAANIEGADAVIYSSAIADSNEEKQAAQEAGVPMFHRAQLLAHFVNQARFSIAVSGTHGKSTTSALVTHLLEKSGHNPTAILGAISPNMGASGASGSNVRLGDEDLVVVEADESDGSFTLCRPTVAVVLNVEAEHLENYDNSSEALWQAFDEFADGADEIVLNADEVFLCDRLDDAACEWALRYAIQAEANFSVDDIRTGGGRQEFDLTGDGRPMGTFSLPLPGRHNISNALAALGAAWLHFVDGQDGDVELGPEQVGAIARHFATFPGIKRRFEKVGEAAGVPVYNDYAHHPTEVAATLQGAREFLDRPLTVVFQPHRFSRTQQMGAAFGPSFERARCVIVTELYSAFEEPIEGVSGRIVFDAVRAQWPDKRVLWAKDNAEAARLALEETRAGEAVVTMGAGDITQAAHLILRGLQDRA